MNGGFPPFIGPPLRRQGGRKGMLLAFVSRSGACSPAAFDERGRRCQDFMGLDFRGRVFRGAP
jgi:hypothetical protein